MPLVARDSGAHDRLVRALCSRYLTPTLQERAGCLNRGKMHDLNGRSHKPQMVLARHYGIENSRCRREAGAYSLTDSIFANLQTCVKRMWNTLRTG